MQDIIRDNNGQDDVTLLPAMEDGRCPRLLSPPPPLPRFPRRFFPGDADPGLRREEEEDAPPPRVPPRLALRGGWSPDHRANYIVRHDAVCVMMFFFIKLK